MAPKAMNDRAATKATPRGPKQHPANNLQQLRERQKAEGGFYLTLAEMARLRGVDESLVSRQENGLRGMSMDDVKEYARILKVDPLDIFPELTID